MDGKLCPEIHPPSLLKFSPLPPLGLNLKPPFRKGGGGAHYDKVHQVL